MERFRELCHEPGIRLSEVVGQSGEYVPRLALALSAVTRAEEATTKDTEIVQLLADRTCDGGFAYTCRPANPAEKRRAFALVKGPMDDLTENPDARSRHAAFLKVKVARASDWGKLGQQCYLESQIVRISENDSGLPERSNLSTFCSVFMVSVICEVIQPGFDQESTTNDLLGTYWPYR